MKVYLDTNIFIAAFVRNHPHYAAADKLWHDLLRKRWTPVTSSHTLAEAFSTLSRAPFHPGISADEAAGIILENVLATTEIVSLVTEDYRTVIKECAGRGWIGDRVYDALHVRAALKAKCPRIYTFNRKHFEQLNPESNVKIIQPPPI